MSEFYRRLPPLGTLVAFEAAYRHQSFTRAADELALSQASISRRIRELEQYLGLKLFERKRYEVVPTADGETFASTVRTSLSEIAKTTDMLRSKADGTQQLTIFADISLAQALIVPVIGEIQQLRPDSKIRVIASSEAIDAVHENFDFGLQYGRRGEDRFCISPIGDDVLFPVCSPEFASQLPKALTASELAKQPLLHFLETGRAWPDWRTFLESFQVKQNKVIEGLTFSSYQICLDVAEKGSGIALGWGHTVKSRLDAGTLIRIPALNMEIPDAINLYLSKQVTLDPLVSQATELLRNKLRSEDDSL